MRLDPSEIHAAGRRDRCYGPGRLKRQNVIAECGFNPEPVEGTRVGHSRAVVKPVAALRFTKNQGGRTLKCKHDK